MTIFVLGCTLEHVSEGRPLKSKRSPSLRGGNYTLCLNVLCHCDQQNDPANNLSPWFCTLQNVSLSQLFILQDNSSRAGLLNWPLSQSLCNIMFFFAMRNTHMCTLFMHAWISGILLTRQMHSCTIGPCDKDEDEWRLIPRRLTERDTCTPQ